MDSPKGDVENEDSYHYRADPSFTDYLNLVNPYTYLKGPLQDMTSKLGDVVNLLGDKSLGFLNSVGDLAESAGGTIYGGLSVSG